MATNWDPNPNNYVYYLAAVDLTSGDASTWDPNPSQPIYAISIDSTNGRIYTSGAFTTIAGESRKYFVGLTNSGDGALPIELLSFNAVVEDNSVKLNWNTATEVNNYGFNLERRVQSATTDKNAEWETLGFIKGNGNSNSPKNYSFTDDLTLPCRQAGLDHDLALDLQYRLKQIDFDGKFEFSDVVEVNIEVPSQFSLEQNYPNPFNPTTTIKYSIPAVETGHAPSLQRITLKVYDILGREVATLVNEQKAPGNYEVKFNGSKIASGVYIYQLKAGSFSRTKKLLLMK